MLKHIHLVEKQRQHELPTNMLKCNHALCERQLNLVSAKGSTTGLKRGLLWICAGRRADGPEQQMGLHGVEPPRTHWGET